MLPDLAVEIKSQSDAPKEPLRERIKPLEEKILQFLALGTEIGMLIDPDKETVTIYYRDNRQPLMLGNGDAIAIPELLPGWDVPVEELWPPVFE